ncbi:MAG: DUF4878 domain-containing protein [Bacteroidetes bacterium]|nr:DUF4878 domain-containing protein [Bacteroidota bacterium]
MKKLLAAIAVTTTLFIAGCNSGGGDPKTVLMAFFDALGKKDFDAAKKLATKESESMFSLIQMGMSMSKDNDNKDFDKFNKDKVEIGDAKIEGDKATVPIKEKANGETTNMILKKEDGKWKVAFDKATFMQMGMEKMKEKGQDPSALIDSVGQGVDKMKNLNMDSIDQQMKEGMQKLEELKKKNPEMMQKAKEYLEKAQEAQKNGQ